MMATVYSPPHNSWEQWFKERLQDTLRNITDEYRREVLDENAESDSDTAR